jgi:hypothetical protein
MMPQTMGKHVPGEKPPKANLRKELLKRGSRVAHVFSCVKWDFSKGEASFWICDDLFEENKAMYVSLIRMDGWFRLGKGEKLNEFHKRHHTVPFCCCGDWDYLLQKELTYEKNIGIVQYCRFNPKNGCCGQANET